MGGLHFLQAILVLALATDFALPVVASFLEGPPGTPASAPTALFDVSIAWGVATFLFLSALFHFIVASVGSSRYRDQLSRGQNQFRWIEYSLSSSIMIILIAMLTGTSDIAALVALFGVNAGMIFFGSVQERYEAPGGSLWPFWLGVVLGVVPWIAIGIYLVSPGSDAQPPGFVYAIFISLFVFFNTFAITQLLQYKKVGRWSNYLTGERTYILLSLLAKSALAWQVFAGTSAPWNRPLAPGSSPRSVGSGRRIRRCESWVRENGSAVRRAGTIQRHDLLNRCTRPRDRRLRRGGTVALVQSRAPGRRGHRLRK